MRFAVALIAATLAEQAQATTVYTQTISFNFLFHNGLSYKHVSGTADFGYNSNNGYEPSIPFSINWMGDEPPHGPLIASQYNGQQFQIYDGSSFGLVLSPQKLTGEPNQSFAFTYDGQTFRTSYKNGAWVGSQVPPSAVPETGQWAMLIAGFGLAGSTLRRKRAVVRPAAEAV